jgi:peptidoglycan hydrolase-like protein with peptidoglycan-binding domain
MRGWLSALARPRLLSLAVLPMFVAQCQPACQPAATVTCEQESELPAGVLPMQRGSTGEYVRTLQSILGSLGFDVGPSGADGQYGAATEAAVRAWQGSEAFGVQRVTGVICMENWRALTVDSESPGD